MVEVVRRQWRRVTWIGVPLSSTRRRVAKLLSACAVFVSLFFSRCASSQMRRPHSLPCLKSFSWMRNVSYEMIRIARRPIVKRRSIFFTSSFDASDTAITSIPLARSLRRGRWARGERGAAVCGEVRGVRRDASGATRTGRP